MNLGAGFDWQGTAQSDPVAALSRAISRSRLRPGVVILSPWDLRNLLLLTVDRASDVPARVKITLRELLNLQYRRQTYPWSIRKMLARACAAEPDRRDVMRRVLQAVPEWMR